jgi:hypothetical protein
MDEDERRDDQVDVQLDERAEVQPEAPINQPAEANHHEDGQQDLSEDGPDEHVGGESLSAKTKNASREARVF